MARPVGMQQVILPRPPATYDQRDQTETRRLLEQALFGPTDSVAISTADSKAVSVAALAFGGGAIDSVAQSMATSSSVRASTADSKAVSDSILISTADSKAVSVASKTPVQPWDTGSATVIAADQFIVQHKHLYLTGTERLTAQGTGELLLTDLGNIASVILGTPKAPSLSFTVPDGFFLDLMQRLTLANQVRATLAGTADLLLTDDFNTRSRITLAGRG